MLVKLLPDQVSENWELIRFAVKECTPDITTAGLNVVLEGLLIDDFQCWWAVIEEGGAPRLYAVVITSIHYDRFFQQNCLRICTLFGYEALEGSQYLEAFETLCKYAQGRECSRIEAFTQRPGIPEFAKKFGFSVDFHITKEL